MKRLLVFLVLIVGGFALLYQLVGEDLVPSTKAGERPPEQQAPPTPGGTGIEVKQGQFGATAEQRGELTYPTQREIPQPDGSVRKENVFVLHAVDSRPVADGLQQLDDVDVRLFERGEPVATLEAVRALVELGVDAAGKPSIAADKEVRLEDAVLTGDPGTRLEGLRLEMARASVLIDDDEVNLYTPTPNDRVRVSFAGDRVFTLAGRGLQARLPRDRDGALQRIDVVILGEPVVSTPGARAEARGRLHYTEDLLRGTGQLSLNEGVVLTLDRGAALAIGEATRADRGGVTVTGDQLLGWLTRRRRTADDTVGDQAAWRMLQLTGAPATVALAELRVTTPRLTVLPGPLGDPFWITAAGGASSIEELETPDRPRTRPPIRGSSPRRIHLWQAGEHLGSLHRAFGFPQWSLRPFEGMRAVAFEAATHLEDGTLTVDASRGVHVFHPDGRRDAVVARGFGEVALDRRAAAGREALRVVGNDGFRLEAQRGRETIELGPDPGTPTFGAHRYELEYGELRAAGAGACRIARDGRDTRVTLLAADREIEADLLGRGARLTDVRRLSAEFADEEVVAFALEGLPATATLTRGGETLVATAPRIAQTGRTSLRMLPPDPADPGRWDGLRPVDRLPRLVRDAAATATRPANRATTTAPRIDLHYLGRDQVLVDALADAEVPARVEASVEERPGEPPVTAALEARRLRALPFAVPPAVAALHAGSGTAAALLGFAPWTTPWILGDEVRHVRIEHPGEGIFEGAAHRLLLSTGAEAALLVGDPDTMTPATATRRSADGVVTARGAQVRVFRDEKVGLQAFRAFPGRSTFLLPEVELHRGPGGGVLSHLLATCQGDIEMRPEAVLFHGPVTARSIAPDGSTPDDPLGIVAQELRMVLDPESGEVKRVLGEDVTLDWSRVSGRAAEIELDLTWSLCTARDPNGATVVLANGLAVSGRSVTVNWRTLAFSGRWGSVAPRFDGEVVPR